MSKTTNQTNIVNLSNYNKHTIIILGRIFNHNKDLMKNSRFTARELIHGFTGYVYNISAPNQKPSVSDISNKLESLVKLLKNGLSPQTYCEVAGVTSADSKNFVKLMNELKNFQGTFGQYAVNNLRRATTYKPKQRKSRTRKSTGATATSRPVPKPRKSSTRKSTGATAASRPVPKPRTRTTTRPVPKPRTRKPKTSIAQNSDIKAAFNGFNRNMQNRKLAMQTHKSRTKNTPKPTTSAFPFIKPKH